MKLSTYRFDNNDRFAYFVLSRETEKGPLNVQRYNARTTAWDACLEEAMNHTEEFGEWFNDGAWSAQDIAFAAFHFVHRSAAILHFGTYDLMVESGDTGCPVLRSFINSFEEYFNPMNDCTDPEHVWLLQE